MAYALLLLGLWVTNVPVYSAGPNAPYREINSGALYAPDPILGYRLRPNATCQSRKFRGDVPVFDVTYHADPLGRRIPTVAPSITPARFAAFFGGSMVFGEGVQDDETIPNQLAARIPFVRPYNFGFRGYSPTQMLAKIEQRALDREIQESMGWGIYLYFPSDLLRVSGHSSIFTWSEGRQPFYELVEGKAVRRGQFRAVDPLRFWFLKQFGKFVQSQNWNLGIHYLAPWKSPAELLCQVIEQSARAFEDQLPGSQFVTVISPNTPAQDPVVQNCLLPRQLAFQDLRRNWKADFPRPFLHPDGHYNPAGARAVAEALAARWPVIPALGSSIP